MLQPLLLPVGDPLQDHLEDLVLGRDLQPVFAQELGELRAAQVEELALLRETVEVIDDEPIHLVTAARQREHLGDVPCAG